MKFEIDIRDGSTGSAELSPEIRKAVLSFLDGCLADVSGRTGVTIEVIYP